jgi:hypothetical protein
VTAATAPATAPRTVVAAEAILDGFFGAVFRLDRDAAGRAACCRFEACVFAVARFLDDRVFCVDFFRAADFAGLPDFTLATFPPVLENRETLIMDHRIPAR